MIPKLGVLDFNPIQYHAPLYLRLASRAHVDLDVLYLTDRGYRPSFDSGFGTTVAWDIDLLTGYSYSFLASTEQPTATIANRIRKLRHWIMSQDSVVVHGYANPWMLMAIAICRARRIPYLLRGDSRPDGQATGVRRHLRNSVARAIVSNSAGCLAVGQLNADFYRQYGARQITFAPYSVDDERFACPPEHGRSELLARWALEDGRPVIMFCGKLYPGKRPLDLAAAIALLPREVTVFFVGDGVLADQIRASLRPGRGVVTGFVNQSELPSYYHAADVLVLPSEAEKWGLVVNEAMAAGALPVVSDRVGAAPDLVRGVGEIYPAGDVPGLAAALGRAFAQLDDPRIRDRVRQHAARYSLDHTAAGFEQAAAGRIDPSPGL